MTKKNLKPTEYSSFYENYINKCGNGNLIDELKENLDFVHDFFNSIPAQKHEYSYDIGKWTVKELMQHIIDAERIFNNRALRFARNDYTELPGFEENDYVPVSKANNRTLSDLIGEFVTLRKSTIDLFKSFDESMLMRIGIASNNKISVRALGFILVGHPKHHCQIIEERYLS